MNVNNNLGLRIGQPLGGGTRLRCLEGITRVAGERKPQRDLRTHHDILPGILNPKTDDDDEEPSPPEKNPILKIIDALLDRLDPRQSLDNKRKCCDILESAIATEIENGADRSVLRALMTVSRKYAQSLPSSVA